MGTAAFGYVAVLSLASTDGVDTTAVNPSLKLPMSAWPAAARPWTKVLNAAMFLLVNSKRLEVTNSRRRRSPTSRPEGTSTESWAMTVASRVADVGVPATGSVKEPAPMTLRAATRTW